MLSKFLIIGDIFTIKTDHFSHTAGSCGSHPPQQQLVYVKRCGSNNNMCCLNLHHPKTPDSQAGSQPCVRKHFLLLSYLSQQKITLSPLNPRPLPGWGGGIYIESLSGA
jgi:hypothetical protein